ncbi:hypothetical protein SEUCBS139899_008240 [Sporothrix eucalyptigena]|uniref:Uncharacterized protein n=1 Tax=Sporothrix eucalyptigena TaxID=1812306 RepID=A0ABP0CGD0_9PEZI
MRFLSFLLALVLAITHVVAESELTHAMELVYMFSKYETERVVYDSGFWLAPNCKGAGLKGGCTFNEFVSYVKRGTVTGAPEIIELNKKFDWTNHAEVQKVVTKLSTMPLDPARPGELYMAGEMSVRQVNPKTTSFTGLYNSMENFDKQVAADISKMTDLTAKTKAQKMLSLSNDEILMAAYKLRDTTRLEKLRDELVKKFSPNGKFDAVYQYTDADGKAQRFDPIQWVEEKTNLWGRTFTTINREKSETKNPQMANEILFDRVSKHVKLFNEDGEDGKGKGLMVYNPKFAGTNARHLAVVNLQKKVGVAFQQVCRK